MSGLEMGSLYKLKTTQWVNCTKITWVKEKTESLGVENRELYFYPNHLMI